MSATEKKDQFRLGFLTAIELPDQGYVGGLLITNRHGRPLEFQCTAPLKPNRTQEILYGSTLGPYVVGEVIARTLVEKAGVKPHLILTERSEILELRTHISIPVGCLETAEGSAHHPSNSDHSTLVARDGLEHDTATVTDREPSTRQSTSAEISHENASHAQVIESEAPGVDASRSGNRLKIGRQWIRLHAAHTDDRTDVEHHSTQVPKDADLREPFERVREALLETVKNATVRA